MEYKGWLGLSSVTGRPGGSIINKTALNVFISANFHYSDHGHKNKTDLGGLNLGSLKGKFRMDQRQNKRQSSKSGCKLLSDCSAADNANGWVLVHRPTQTADKHANGVCQ